jgi:hypothetical protein
MEFQGPYLLLCLFSLLIQVTAESPTPKVKKAANVKKGKEDIRVLPIFQEAGHPASCHLTLLPFMLVLGELPWNL